MSNADGDTGTSSTSARRTASRSASPCRPAGLSTTSHCGRDVLQLLLPRFAGEAARSAETAPAAAPASRVAERCGSAIGERDALALAGEPAGDVGGERRLAAAALRIGDQDRLHDRPLPRTGRPDDDGQGAQHGSGDRAESDVRARWQHRLARLFHGALPRPPCPSTHSTLIARTAAGDAELAAPRHGLVIAAAAAPDHPRPVRCRWTSLPPGRAIAADRLERDLARLAEHGLIEIHRPVGAQRPDVPGAQRRSAGRDRPAAAAHADRFAPTLAAARCACRAAGPAAPPRSPSGRSARGRAILVGFATHRRRRRGGLARSPPRRPSRAPPASRAVAARRRPCAPPIRSQAEETPAPSRSIRAGQWR